MTYSLRSNRCSTAVCGRYSWRVHLEEEAGLVGLSNVVAPLKGIANRSACTMRSWMLNKRGCSNHCKPSEIVAKSHEGWFDIPHSGAGTNQERSSACTLGQPINMRARWISLRNISKMDATPVSPAAASPYR